MANNYTGVVFTTLFSETIENEDDKYKKLIDILAPLLLKKKAEIASLDNAQKPYQSTICKQIELLMCKLSNDERHIKSMTHPLTEKDKYYRNEALARCIDALENPVMFYVGPIGSSRLTQNYYLAVFSW